MSYYLVDGLGSTRLLTDGLGQVLNSYGYEAFGETTSQSGTASNKYQFAGEQFDSALGDYYLRQRFYDTSSGRFGRMDTYHGVLSSPVTLNKYVYGNANPINYTDPSGYFSKFEVMAAFVISNILWNAINPFNINGVDLLADNPFSAIDPTRGLGGRISFRETFDFVKETILHRAVNQLSKGRNVAVAVFKDSSGKKRILAVNNQTAAENGLKSGLHAEQILAGELSNRGITAKNVIRIYSERQPCTTRDNNCASFLRTTYPNVPIYWSYPYNDVELKQIGYGVRELDLEMYGIKFK
jgi:RHS repeat-associated protein